MPRILTGVGSHFCATHKDHKGRLHGHSYEVTAWHECKDRNDAVILQTHLDGLCKAFDHTELPSGLEWAEDIAVAILGLSPPSCVEVVVGRPLERLYARAIA